MKRQMLWTSPFFLTAALLCAAGCTSGAGMDGDAEGSPDAAAPDNGGGGGETPGGGQPGADGQPGTVNNGEQALLVSSPARGAFVNLGEAVQVQGQVVNPATGTTVLINGQEASLDGQGNFSATVTPVRGMNLVEVSAEGSEFSARDVRAVVSGEYAAWDAVSPNALTGRITGDGLAMIADSLSDNLGPELLAGLDLSALEGSEEFQLRGIDLSGITVGLEPLDGVLRVTVRLFGLDIDFDASLDGLDVSGEVESDPAELILDVVLETDGLGGLDIRFASSEIEMHDFDFDVGGLLGLVDWVIKGAVEDGLEEALLEFIQNTALDDVLTADSLTQEIDVLGQAAQLRLLLTDLSVDPGGLNFRTDIGLNISPKPDARPAPGAYTTPGGESPPSWASLDAMGGPNDGSESLDAAPGGMKLGLSDDFLNHLLAGLWRAGGLVIDLDQIIADMEAKGKVIPLRFDIGTLATLTQAPALRDMGAPETPVEMTIVADLPPILTLDPSQQRPLTVALGELRFEFAVGTQRWATVSTHLVLQVGTRPATETEPASLDLAVVTAEADLIDAPLFDVNELAAEGTLVSILNLLPALLTGDDDEDMVEMGEGDIAEMTPGMTMGEIALSAPNAGFMALVMDLTVALTPEKVPELDVLAVEINPDNGHQYALLSQSSWSDAEAFARALGGHLVTIRSRDENDWLIDTFGYWEGQTRDLWIGLHDVGHEGTFTWVSGEPVTFTRWAGDPDNGREEDETGFSEDFVHIYGDRSRRADERWNDFKNLSSAPWNEGFHGVVEIIE